MRHDTDTKIVYKFRDSIYYFYKEDFKTWPAGDAFICYNEYPSQPGQYIGLNGDSKFWVTTDEKGEQQISVVTTGQDVGYSHPNVFLTHNTESLSFGYMSVHYKVTHIKDLEVHRHYTPYYPSDIATSMPQIDYILEANKKPDSRFLKLVDHKAYMYYVGTQA